MNNLWPLFLCKTPIDEPGFSVLSFGQLNLLVVRQPLRTKINLDEVKHHPLLSACLLASVFYFHFGAPTLQKGWMQNDVLA